MEEARQGRLTFRLDGEKLHGRWHLVRASVHGERQDPWLLIKADDDAARSVRAPDILEEEPWSVANDGRLMKSRRVSRRASGALPLQRNPPSGALPSGPDGARPKAPSQNLASLAAVPHRRPAELRSSRSKPVARKSARTTSAGNAVELTHPDRVYWDDVGVTKQELADYYRDIWDHMAPHVIGRPLALLRCPDGASGQCFFQKHAHATFNQGHILRLRDKGDEIIAIEDLAGMIALVQAGVLEVHVWGSTLAHIDACDRMVFDLDPGPGVSLAQVVAATKETRARLASFKLESFVKTTGGKGFHVMVPLTGEDWDRTKEFAHALALAMEADAPDRYVSKMTKSKRKGRIFIDYLRNGRGATSVAAYSTRARAGAPVSTPIDWSELNARLAPDKFTVRNLRQRLARLRHDPWRELARVKQKLPVAK